MILKKLFFTSTTPLLFTALCTALRIDYPRNEVSINHQQNFNPMRPSSRPQNTFKQQVEVVGKFNSGSGKRFPGLEVDNVQMGFRPTPSYPHQFGGTNMENKFPTYSPRTPSFPTNFGVGSSKLPGFPVNFGGSSPKSPGFPVSFGGSSAKSPSFTSNFGENNRFPPKTPSFSSNFGDAQKNSLKTPTFHPLSSNSQQFSPSPQLNFKDSNSFLPKTPTNFNLDSYKNDHSPMLHPKQAEELRSRLQFTTNSNFGRQNRQPIGEGNVRNNFKTEQKSYKDVFGKTFEDTRKTNPLTSGFPNEEGKSISEDVSSGFSGTESGDFSSGISGDDDFIGDDFDSKLVGEVDDAAKFDVHNHKKYEKNYASGYFHNAHTYYKLF